jgi:hypothetical protein
MLGSIPETSRVAVAGPRHDGRLHSRISQKATEGIAPHRTDAHRSSLSIRAKAPSFPEHRQAIEPLPRLPRAGDGKECRPARIEYEHEISQLADGASKAQSPAAAGREMLLGAVKE